MSLNTDSNAASQADGAKIYLRLLVYLKPYIGYFLLSVVGYMLYAASQPALAKLMEVIVEAIEAKDVDARYYIPALLIGIYIFRGVGLFLGSYFMALVANRLVVDLRAELFEHTMRLPTKFYDDNNSGQIIARIAFNTGMVTGAATDALKILFREGFTIIGLLAYAFYLNWKLTLSFAVVAPIIAVLVYIVGKRLRKLSTKVQNSIAEITLVCNEAIHNIRIVKTMRGEQREIGRFLAANRDNLKQQMRIVKTTAINAPLLQLLVVAAMSFIVYLILAPSFLNEMTTGEYLSYITAIGLIPKSLKQLSGVNTTIQRGIAAAYSIFEMLDLEQEKNSGQLRAETLEGDVQVKGLSFSYGNDDNYALRDINCSVAAGQSVALVGRSGSGKSTLASLIARLYEYKTGEILVDGIDIRDYDLADYRKHLGIVTQSVNLFGGTIAENIAYGAVAGNVSDEEIRHAALQANALEFIEALPHGFNTVIGENGVMLSGGQKQRIAIARTLVCNPPLLILDEATSALDNESERAIQTSIETAMKHRTTLIIAHRLSTIVNSDMILVFDNGRIVEQGTHDELLKRDAHYKNLYQKGFDDS